MRPVPATLFGSLASSAAAMAIAVSTCNGNWIVWNGYLIVIVGVLLQAWDFIRYPNAGAMPFWLSDGGHQRARAAIIAFILGTALQGFGNLLWAVINRVFRC